MLSCIFFFQMQ